MLEKERDAGERKGYWRKKGMPEKKGMLEKERDAGERKGERRLNSQESTPNMTDTRLTPFFLACWNQIGILHIDIHQKPYIVTVRQSRNKREKERCGLL